MLCYDRYFPFSFQWLGRFFHINFPFFFAERWSTLIRLGFSAIVVCHNFFWFSCNGVCAFALQYVGPGFHPLMIQGPIAKEHYAFRSHWMKHMSIHEFCAECHYFFVLWIQSV